MAVEAKSLSSLIALADDPPSHLSRSEDHVHHDTLVLYIARVPGSRDVVLTTMKPREKVVSAQDVESCLYYCHVNSTDDDELREALSSLTTTEASRPEGRNSAPPPLADTTNVQRKPLPGALPAKSGSDALFSYRPHNEVTVGVEAPTSQQIKRKPVGMSGQSSTPDAMGPAPSSSPPKPAGPRPLKSRGLSEDKSTIGRLGPGGLEHPPNLPPRPRPNVPDSPAKEHFNLLDSSTQSPARSQAYSITVIRRDPASGGQWNVGKISVGLRQPSSSLTATYSNKVKQGSGVMLDIMTPGYGKFVDQSIQQTSSEGDKLSTEQTLFQRYFQLQQPKSQSNNRSPKRKSFRSSIDMSSGRELGTSETIDIRESNPPFSFVSPWGGLCEFNTGLSGRTLKCKHTSKQEIYVSETDPQHKAFSTAISELRLNLPSTNMRNPKSPRRPPPFTTSSSRSSFISAIKAHHRSSSFESGSDDHDTRNENEERLDLSLGQEHAGGGMSGKKAKLGKLLVEHDGLQMLDLVVAANIGFWFSLSRDGR